MVYFTSLYPNSNNSVAVIGNILHNFTAPLTEEVVAGGQKNHGLVPEDEFKLRSRYVGNNDR